MNENEQTFGKFIEERRKALGITLRGFRRHKKCLLEQRCRNH